MLTIDIGFFPHIFDNIFDAADYEALLHLRLTCKTLRDRVNDEWSHLKWIVHLNRPNEAVNRRGVVIPGDSPCLRFTTVLDITEADDRHDVQQVPGHLRPDVIRLLDVGVTSLTASAKTIIVLDEDGGDSAGRYAQRALGPRQDPVALIYSLDCREWESVLRTPEYFIGVAAMQRPADVYLLLSGCNPAGDCVKDLCSKVADSLADDYCDIVDAGATPSPAHNFYFVDVPSWFDTSLAPLPESRPGRMERILTRPSTFFGYMLAAARYGDDLIAEASGTEYDRDWPSEMFVERVLRRLHCITKEEMRERVGDRAYELTFAPRDICAP